MSDRTWKALRDHHAKIRDVHLRQLFADDPRRGERLTVEGVGLYLDYSKHRVTDETLRLLFRLAEEVLDRFAQAGVDVNGLAADLQRDGAAAFVTSWKELLACLVDKSQTLKKAG